MTPAIELLKKGKIPFELHEYEHDSSAGSYGDEAAEKLGISTDIVFKTLVVDLGNRAFAAAVLPVSCTLSLKKMAKACGAKRAAMAGTDEVQRATGYVLGGVSPLGQKKRLPTVIDNSAETLPRIYVSAGKRGMDIELAPSDLKQMVNGTFGDIVA